MEKKFEDEELNKLLDEQLVKEAELIEQALFSDDSFEDYEETDEELKASYQKLVERLKADGVYREDDENDSDGSDTGSGDEVNKEQDENGIHSVEHKMSEGSAEKVVAMPVSDKTEEKRKASKSHKIAKAAGFVVVGTLCVFAASMTSEANRTYFINSINYFAGNDAKIDINNIEGELEGKEEYEAINEIEQELGIQLPEFMYRPDGFIFISYNINKLPPIACLEYSYKGDIISLIASKKDTNAEKQNVSLHGGEIQTINVSNETIKAEMLAILGENEKTPNYNVCWEREDTFYQVTGKMNKNEFIKLIQKMVF